MGVFDSIFGGALDLLTNGAEALVKARRGDAAPSSAQIPPEPPKDEALQALLSDPFALLETLGYRERPSSITYGTLQQLAYRIPVMPGILQTRLNQIVRFGSPQMDDMQSGYAIKTRDPDARPTKATTKQLRDLEHWIATCGSTKALSRDRFKTWLRKFVRDSLIYDQACSEIVDNRKGQPSNFYAIDGGSIRIADTAWDGQHDPGDNEVRYVQVHDENVIAELTPKQLIFGVRNPRTDLRVNGYGMSEMEMTVNTVTGLLNGFAYNSKYFSQGSVAKGMLNLPDVADDKLRIFARQWHMIAAGVLNAWRTPITNFKEANWIDFHKSNRDMEFGQWTDFLIKLFCAAYCIDPAEIHFLYGNVGQQQQLFQSPEIQKHKASQDKGLVPLLDFVADCINTWLIWRIDEDFIFCFTGLNPKDSQAAIDAEKKQVTYLKQVNELRAENDLPPLPPELGDLILDPTWMQAYQAVKQQQQMAAQGPPGQQGQPGQEQPGQEQPGQEQPGQEQPGGPPGQEKQGQGEQPEAKEEPMNWQEALGRAEKSLTAHVRERRDGDVIEYEIEI